MVHFVKTDKVFEDWYIFNEHHLLDVFHKTIETLWNKTSKYYPITSMSIDDDNLYTSLVLYIYKTSYNKCKRYQLRNI
jgi:hypothetical protein